MFVIVLVLVLVSCHVHVLVHDQASSASPDRPCHAGSFALTDRRRSVALAI
jgi:hypothetical protein